MHIGLKQCACVQYSVAKHDMALIKRKAMIWLRNHRFIVSWPWAKNMQLQTICLTKRKKKEGITLKLDNNKVPETLLS